MPKLKKDEFNKRYRFREARKEGLVACVSCASVSGEVDVTEALCVHEERGRKVQIANGYAQDPRSSWSTARSSLCDAFTSKPLPVEIVPIVFREGEGAVLTTQFADCIHVDANCPYVIEEQRLAKTGGRSGYCNRPGEVRVIDTTEIVPGEAHWDACEMPCCEKKLQPQICNPNTYRNLVGIHPNASDPRRFVRNGLHRHGRKSNMSYEEAEAFFEGVKQIASVVAEKGIHARIIAVSDYIGQQVNSLGSKPLSEAANPVYLGGSFHLIAAPSWLRDRSNWRPLQDSTGTGADVWVYDERLFDSKKELDMPLIELQKIPEGIILCVDSKGVLRNLRRVNEGYRLGERFNFSGILKPFEDRRMLARGLSHFLDIRGVSYHAHEHMWGESGIGFSDLASFDGE